MRRGGGGGEGVTFPLLNRSCTVCALSHGCTHTIDSTSGLGGTIIYTMLEVKLGQSS